MDAGHGAEGERPISPRGPVLEACGVSVRFGGVKALTDVSLALQPGTITGLVGPNGAGKTTLFQVLSGLLRPSAGRVLLEGRDVTGVPASRRAERGLARTFQRPQLFSGLTVRQHMALAYRMRREPSRFWQDALGLGRRGRSAHEDDRIAELASMLDLERLLDVDVDHVGLGTARVVEVARALAGHPQVLLLDEPSSGLAAHETARITEVLVSVQRQEGVSLLLVEHDLELVMQLSQEVHVLDFGQMIAVGPPELVRADPAVQAAYVGAPG